MKALIVLKIKLYEHVAFFRKNQLYFHFILL